MHGPQCHQEHLLFTHITLLAYAPEQIYLAHYMHMPQCTTTSV